MAHNPKELISIDVPKTKFEEFLREDNKRIFFSGQFGIGKTFFLQKFFEERASEYDVYHLFPVNYQISSNENIVEFLKYDILVELLKKYPQAFEAENVKGVKGNFKIFAAFWKDHGLGNRLPESAIDTLLAAPDPFSQALGRLGRSLGTLFKLKKEFEEFKREYFSGDRGTIDKYLDAIESENSLVTTDYISHLLGEMIESSKGNRRSILILDDFDRIDPEHTFRILNILSAYVDGNEENKFGFDHIIIVGAVANLRSVFHHKYGDDTDFEGYFDKFFTVKPYPFDNDRAIAERIPYLIEHIQSEDVGLKSVMRDRGVVKRFLEEVMVDALSVKAMNLRQLYKPINHPFEEVKAGTYQRDTSLDTENQCIDIGIKLLIAIYGDQEGLLKALDKIKNASSNTLSGEKRDFYKRRTSSMLKRLLVDFRLKAHPKWLGYSMDVIGDDSSVNIYPKEDTDLHARFFYDTLFEYVKQSKYKKRSIEDYEPL